MTNTTTKHIVIAGASGFVGSSLVPRLRENGWKVTQLVRSRPKSHDQVQWNPQAGDVDLDVISSADVVINLAGASIAGGLWTEKRKKLIHDSRIAATSTLANAIATAASKPDVYINTSAVGYYGSRPGERLTEESTAGDGFLADVCVEWEAAADSARNAGVRVVHPRFGVVFDGNGGMLPVIKLPFSFGIGGRIGGDQYMPWIDLHDLVEIFPFLIQNEEIEGPVNAVSPNPVTNAEFTRAMGDVLHRPTIIPVPKKIAAIAGGDLAKDLLLTDQRVVPHVLEQAGFEFDRPLLRQSLEHAFR